MGFIQTLRIVGFVIVMAAAPTLALALQYEFTDLGTLGGPFALADGINSDGQVVGYSETSAPRLTVRGFVWNGGPLQPLGTLGGTNSLAGAINDLGQIVGEAFLPGDTAVHPVLFDHGGSAVDLGTFGGFFGAAFGINNHGQIVGRADAPSITTPGTDVQHAFLFSGDMLQNLGSLGGTNSRAIAINDAGQVVGESQVVGNAATHAFLYAAGAMHDLGTLGGTNSTAFNINSAGNIVGSSNAIGFGGALHPFLFKNGMMTDLGTLPGIGGFEQNLAFDINDLDQIVGTSGGDAFLYTNGEMLDLNMFLPPGFTGALREANAINNSGQIVGRLDIAGDSHAFLLTPVPSPLPIPEPSSFILLLSGLAAVLTVRGGQTFLRSSVCFGKRAGHHGPPLYGRTADNNSAD